MKNVRFADQPLTKLTEKYVRARTDNGRRRVLEKALPLCKNVPDVWAFLTKTFWKSSLYPIICCRWDRIMLERIDDTPHWTIRKAHAYYLHCRSDSDPEKYVLAIWQQLARGVQIR